MFNPYRDAGRYFPRQSMRVLQTLRDSRPRHYTAIAADLGERSNLSNARLIWLFKRGDIAKAIDVGRGWYVITRKGLDRLAYLERNDPSV